MYVYAALESPSHLVPTRPLLAALASPRSPESDRRTASVVPFRSRARVAAHGVMADVASMSLEERAARFSPLVSGTDRVKRPAAQWAETPVAPGAGGLERVFAAGDGDMWVARRFFPMIPYVLNLPTTMAVHRDAAGSLTLFNALRLAPEVEEELLALGPVRRVVKLGQFHGAADAYYAKDPKFESPEFWTLNGGSTAYVWLSLLCPWNTLPVADAAFDVCAFFFFRSLGTRPSAHCCFSVAME